MRLGPRASLLVAFYLLASAATARAECAWVPWAYYSLDRYAVLGSRETRKQCDAAQMHASDQAKKTGAKMETVRLRDTVDPRVPKGK